MIAKDLLPELLVQVIDANNKFGVMPHICNYKGVIAIRLGDHEVMGREHILHTFTLDELQEGFTEKTKFMLEQIVLEECQEFGYIQPPIIKRVT